MEEQRARRDDQARIDRRDVRTDRAETILVALLQVGSEIAIDAARTLLNHHWRGEEMLKDFYFRLKAGLEEETQQAWDSRLRPPGSPER